MARAAINIDDPYGARLAGLTKTAAERALQKLIDAEVRVVPIGERVDLQTAVSNRLLEGCLVSVAPRGQRRMRPS